MAEEEEIVEVVVLLTISLISQMIIIAETLAIQEKFSTKEIEHTRQNIELNRFLACKFKIFTFVEVELYELH